MPARSPELTRRSAASCAPSARTTVAAVAGKWVLAFKVKAFALGSAALGLAGALYGHYTSYIAPDIFVPLLTLYIKLVAPGRRCWQQGARSSAPSLVVTFLESTRFIVPLVPGLSPSRVRPCANILSGALLVLLRFAPKASCRKPAPTSRWRPPRPAPDRVSPPAPVAPFADPALNAITRPFPRRPT